MFDMGGPTTGVEDIDALLDELSTLMDRLDDVRSAPRPAQEPPTATATESGIHLVTKSAPGLDARNVFRRVIDAYLSERPVMDAPALLPLRELTAAPLEEHERALFDLHQAEELFTRIGDREGLAVAITNAGTVYAAAAAFPEALEKYAKGLALFGAMGDVRNVSRCITNIGVVQTALPDYARALSVLTEALQLMHYAEAVRSDRAAEDLFVVFRLLQETVRTLEQYTPALAIVRRRR